MASSRYRPIPLNVRIMFNALCAQAVNVAAHQPQPSLEAGPRNGIPQKSMKPTSLGENPGSGSHVNNWRSSSQHGYSGYKSCDRRPGQLRTSHAVSPSSQPPRQQPACLAIFSAATAAATFQRRWNQRSLPIKRGWGRHDHENT